MTQHDAHTHGRESWKFARPFRAMGMMAIATACLLAAGCAAPGRAGWADFKASRDVDIAAADESFPSAAEAGLASSDTSDAKLR